MDFFSLDENIFFSEQTEWCLLFSNAWMESKVMFNSKNWCIHFSFSLFCYHFKNLKKKKNQFSHNLSTKYTPLIWLLFPTLGEKKILFFFSVYMSLQLLCLSNLKGLSNWWVLVVFKKLSRISLYSFSLKMKKLKVCIYFLYSNANFRILKMKTEYKSSN